MKRLSLGRGKDELTGKNTSGERRLDHPPGGGALARRLDDRTFFAKLRAGTSEEQDQGGDAARNRDDEVEPAERHHEVGRVHQAHAVQRETEKDDREHLVELEEALQNPCSQVELNKIVPFGFSLQRQKMVFFFAIKIV